MHWTRMGLNGSWYPSARCEGEADSGWPSCGQGNAGRLGRSTIGVGVRWTVGAKGRKTERGKKEETYLAFSLQTPPSESLVWPGI